MHHSAEIVIQGGEKLIQGSAGILSLLPWRQHCVVVHKTTSICLFDLRTNTPRGSKEVQGRKVLLADPYLFIADAEEPIIWSIDMTAFPEGRMRKFVGFSKWVCSMEVADLRGCGLPNLVACSADNTARAWPLPSQQAHEASGKAMESKMLFQGHTDYVTCLRFDDSVLPGSRALFTGSCDKRVLCWALSSSSSSPDSSSSPAGGGAAGGPAGGSSISFASKSPTFELTGHTNWIFSLETHKGFLYSGSKDCTVRQWNLKTRQCSRVLDVGAFCYDMIFSPGGRLLVTDSYFRVTQWNPKSGKKVGGALEGHRGKITHLWMGKSHIISSAKDNSIRLWSKTGKGLVVYRGHEGPVNTFVFMNGLILSASDDGTLRQWHCTTDNPEESENAVKSLDPRTRSIIKAQAVIRRWLVRQHIVRNKAHFKGSAQRYAALNKIINLHQDVFFSLLEVQQNYRPSLAMVIPERLKPTFKEVWEQASHITKLHGKFKVLLEVMAEEWPVVCSLGSVYGERVEELLGAYARYQVAYREAIRGMAMHKDDHLFIQRLNEVSVRTGNSLHHLLSVPFFHFARMLPHLKTLLSSTLPSSDDFVPLLRLLSIIFHVSRDMSDVTHVVTRDLRMAEVQKSIHMNPSLKFEWNVPNRDVLMEGKVIWSGRRRYVVVMSDCILVCKMKRSKKLISRKSSVKVKELEEVVPFKTARVKEVKGSKDRGVRITTLEATHMTDKGEPTFRNDLRPLDGSAVDDWLDAVDRAVARTKFNSSGQPLDMVLERESTNIPILVGSICTLIAESASASVESILLGAETNPDQALRNFMRKLPILEGTHPDLIWVLMRYLVDLPEPLVPDEVFHKLMDNPSKNDLASMFTGLRDSHAAMLSYIVHFLSDLCSRDRTSNTAYPVAAALFGPVLLRRTSKPLHQWLPRFHTSIMEVFQELVKENARVLGPPPVPDKYLLPSYLISNPKAALVVNGAQEGGRSSPPPSDVSPRRVRQQQKQHDDKGKAVGLLELLDSPSMERAPLHRSAGRLGRASKGSPMPSPIHTPPSTSPNRTPSPPPADASAPKGKAVGLFELLGISEEEGLMDFKSSPTATTSGSGTTARRRPYQRAALDTYTASSGWSEEYSSGSPRSSSISEDSSTGASNWGRLPLRKPLAAWPAQSVGHLLVHRLSVPAIEVRRALDTGLDGASLCDSSPEQQEAWGFSESSRVTISRLLKKVRSRGGRVRPSFKTRKRTMRQQLTASIKKEGWMRVVLPRKSTGKKRWAVLTPVELVLYKDKTRKVAHMSFDLWISTLPDTTEGKPHFEMSTSRGLLWMGLGDPAEATAWLSALLDATAALQKLAQDTSVSLLTTDTSFTDMTGTDSVAEDEEEQPLDELSSEKDEWDTIDMKDAPKKGVAVLPALPEPEPQPWFREAAELENVLRKTRWWKLEQVEGAQSLGAVRGALTPRHEYKLQRLRGRLSENVEEDFVLLLLLVTGWSCSRSFNLAQQYAAHYQEVSTGFHLTSKMSTQVKTGSAFLSSVRSLEAGGLTVVIRQEALDSRLPFQVLANLLMFYGELLLEDVPSQLGGCSVILDLRAWTPSSAFKPRWWHQLLDFLQHGFPCRVDSVFVLDPPESFPRVWEAIRPMMCKRFMACWKIVSRPTLRNFFPAKEIPSFIGGRARFSVTDFLQEAAIREASAGSRGALRFGGDVVFQKKGRKTRASRIFKKSSRARLRSSKKGSSPSGSGRSSPVSGRRTSQ